MLDCKGPLLYQMKLQCKYKKMSLYKQFESHFNRISSNL